MTIVPLMPALAAADGLPMTEDPMLLARLLAIAALVAATTDYAEIIRRRTAGRAAARERAMFEHNGLYGLVRLFLADALPETPQLTPRRR